MDEFDEIDRLEHSAKGWQEWARIAHQQCELFADEPETLQQLQRNRKQDSLAARNHLFMLLDMKKG